MRVVARRRAWPLAALSVAAAVWLGEEVAASATERSGSWPVTGFAMFSAPRADATTFELTAATASGRRRSVPASDFGFRYPDQLAVFLWTRVFDRAAAVSFPQGTYWLSRLAGAWSRRHAADPAVGLTLDVRVASLREGGPVTHHRIVWGRA